MDEIIGTIKLFAGNFAQENFAFCNGELLDITANPALFSILGVTYGGNGTTNFSLPKLEGPSGTFYIIAINGIYPSRG